MKKALTHQGLLFKLAVIFLTRIPLSIKQNVDDELLNKATGYFGFVGLLVACCCALVLATASLVLPVSIAVILSMIFGLMFTGAFHEDGLADTADGFGGGWSSVDKLTIMKDSRLGTYGASALCLVLLLKFQSLLFLSQVSLTHVLLALCFAHVMSRVLAVSIIPSLDYVQLENETKTKPVAKSLADSSILPLMLSVLLVFLLLIHYLNLSFIIILGFICLVLFVRFAFIKLCEKQIGGYTGDVLGAAQQVFELVIYLFILIVIGVN